MLVHQEKNVCGWSHHRRSDLQNIAEGTLFVQSRDFRKNLENSLNKSEVTIFCHDFLNLLKYNQKRHKEKVPCLVGDANSGKTRLFFPILGLVRHRNFATVTKQRAFKKSMISPFNEVIFIDKATESTMEISDWKILAEGGYTAHYMKYQKARACINKCPMLITVRRNSNLVPQTNLRWIESCQPIHFGASLALTAKLQRGSSAMRWTMLCGQKRKPGCQKVTQMGNRVTTERAVAIKRNPIPSKYPC